MAKTDAFFIRASVPIVDNTYTQTEIDLGAFVDALAETVLRIHSVEWQYSDDSGPGGPYQAGGTLNMQSQITTQTQTGLVNLDNRSVVASSILMTSALADGGAGANYVSSNVEDVGPQAWEAGYLIGVESIFLASQFSDAPENNSTVSILLECTSERLTKGAAMALALTQQ